MLAYLKLVRWPNLVFIALTLSLIRFSLFDSFQAALSLSTFGFSLLLLATLCIAASGYVINDIYDVQADKINKPQKLIIGKTLSEKTAYNVFILLNILGVGIGFYLANIIGHPGFVAIFIFSSALLYMYASYLKQLPLLGNILISGLVAFVVLLPVIFDLYPVISAENQRVQAMVFSLLLDYALFAFLVNLIREIIKDQEDIKGDYNSDISSLPILLGQSRTNKIIFVMVLLTILSIIYYIYNFLFENTYLVLYVLVFILAPLLYLAVQIWEASKKKHYSHLSIILKIVLFFGLISIGFHHLLVNEL